MVRLRLAALAATCALAPAASADFTVTGNFRYVDRAFTFSNGVTSSEPALPIRLARVQVVNASSGQVLATGATDENGDVSIFVPGSGTKDVLVRCYSESKAFGSKWLRVTNTSSVLYSTSSSTFSSWNQSVDLNVGTVTAQKIFSGAYQANPFNMLDQMVWSIQYVKSVGGGNPSSNLRMQWPGGSGSWASGSMCNMATDDGYDDIVQLHEMGHVVHNVYSDSDSPGGSHSFSQSDQDPRLSLGEGWASFFAGAVRQYAGIHDPGFYMDFDGDGSTGTSTIQLRMRFENGWPYGGSTGGEADEGAVHCALWDLVDTTTTSVTTAGDDDAVDGSLVFGAGLDGDEVQWASFVGHVSGASNLTIRDLWDGLFTPTDHGNLTEVGDMFAAWGIAFQPDAAEPNDTVATATPIALSPSFGPTRTLYHATSPAGAPGDGDSDYYSFQLTAGSVFSVETRYPGGNSDAETYCDPRIQVRRPSGSILASDDSSGTGRNALLSELTADATGTWTVRVYSNHSYRKTGSYELRVELDSGPPGGSAPDIAAVTPAAIEQVTVDGPGSVTLTGSGFTGVNAVSVAGQALSGAFPPEFTVIDDGNLILSMPLVDTMGLTPIVISSPGGTDATLINVVANDPPVTELKGSNPGFLLQAVGLEVTLGSRPGDLFFLCGSPDPVPTTIPGIVDLGIGAGYTSLFILATPVIPAKGYAEVHIPMAGLGLPPGFQLHLQSAVLSASGGFALPAASTNVQSGTVLF